MSSRGAKLLHELQTKSLEINPICTSAPIIWDAENTEDARLAKKNCLGYPASDNSDGLEPCPLLKLCFETAIENNEQFGVWGGTTAYERKRMRKRLK